MVLVCGRGLDFHEMMLMRRTTRTVIVLALLSVSAAGLLQSAKGAVTWSAPVLTDLSTPPSFDILPSTLQANDGSLWLAWQSNRANPFSFRSDIYYKTLSSGLWSLPVNITGPGTVRVNNAGPSLAQLHNNTILLFWVANTTGAYNIYYERYNAGIWSGLVHLTIGSGNDTDPDAVVTQDGTLWLSWARKISTCCGSTAQIFYKTLVGNVWSSETQLTSDATLNLYPGLTATKDGRVWLVWSKWLNAGKIYQVFSSINNGTSWSPAYRIVSSNSLDAHPDVLQDRNGTLWLFWARDLSIGGGLFETKIFTKSSFDNGLSWSADTQLTFDPLCCQTDESDPAPVTASGNTIWIFFDSTQPTGSTLNLYYVTSSPIFPVHNVAVSKIAYSPTLLYPGGMKSVGQSGIAKINVTVTDPGDFVETVAVQVTAVNKTSYIAGSATATVSPGGSAIIQVAWNTTDVLAARYALVATVAPVAGESLGNVAGNRMAVGSAVHILPLGDVDQDGSVGVVDASTVALAFQSTPGSPYWNPYADINGKGIVDIIDVAIMAKNYGIVT